MNKIDFNSDKEYDLSQDIICECGNIEYCHGEEGFACNKCNRLYEICEKCNRLYKEIYIEFDTEKYNEKSYEDFINEYFEKQNYEIIDREKSKFFKEQYKYYIIKQIFGENKFTEEEINKMDISQIDTILFGVFKNFIKFKYLPDSTIIYVWYCTNCGNTNWSHPD